MHCEIPSFNASLALGYFKMPFFLRSFSAFRENCPLNFTSWFSHDGTIGCLIQRSGHFLSKKFGCFALVNPFYPDIIKHFNFLRHESVFLRRFPPFRLMGVLVYIKQGKQPRSKSIQVHSMSECQVYTL